MGVSKAQENKGALIETQPVRGALASLVNRSSCGFKSIHGLVYGRTLVAWQSFSPLGILRSRCSTMS